MSSSFYPLGMNSYNNRLPQGGYKSSKGTGVFSNPTGVTAGNIRPLTNNDLSNSAPQKFGLPRPIKHYRKGISVALLENSTNSRQVKSSTGGGSLVGQMIDIPGGFSIKENPSNETSNTEELDKDCKTCQGVGIISNWQPITDLTEKPQSETQTQQYCCNQERNALRRMRSANTKLKKNYYTTKTNYLYNRCQTFDQKQFNYMSLGNAATKPGAPLSQDNIYKANCNPNLEIEYAASLLPDGITLTPSNPLGCETVQYKPNNYKYGQQGAVSSSDRMLRLNVDTIDANRANIIKNRENLTKSKYFPNASGTENNSCCIIGSKAVSSFGTTILYITYPLVTRTFRTLTQRFSFPSSFSSISDPPVPVIQNEYILVVPSYELIDPNTNKVKMTLKYQLFTNNDAELLTVGLSFANNVNYYNQNTSIIEIIQFDGMPLYGLGNQFSGLTPEILISAPDEPRIINGTSALNCFMDCTNFNSPGIINWNIANIVNLQGMFANASLFNQDISVWDTSSVTNVSYMFYFASAFNQEVTNWDVTNVTTMANMFALATNFNNGDITNIGSKSLNSWNTQSVTNMTYMFYAVSTFNQEVTNWDVTNVTTMANMFALATNFNNGDITNIGSKSLSSWDVSNCTSFAGMFKSASSFNQNVSNLVNTNTSGLTPPSGCNLSYMFQSATLFNNGDPSNNYSNLLNWDTTNVTNMTYMFKSASSFNQYIGNWNTARVTDMTYMFQTATLFNNGETGTLDISGNAATAYYTTSGSVLTCPDPTIISGLAVNNVIIITTGPSASPTIVYTSKIATIPTSSTLTLSTNYGSNIGTIITSIKKQVVGTKDMSWNTSILTPDMQYMFSDATYFNQHVSTFTVGNATHMFSSTVSPSLRGIFNNGQLAGSNDNSLRYWNTAASGSIGAMFFNSAGFNQNVSNWNVSNVGYTSQMFQGTQVYNNGLAPGLFNNDSSLNSWNTSNFDDIQVMFNKAVAFNQNISNWDVSKVTTMNATFNGATLFNNGDTPGASNQPLTSWYAPKCVDFVTMFLSAVAFNQPIPILVDTSGIILDATGSGVTLGAMFQGASIFNQNVSTWNTSKVTIMSSVFQSASVFNNGDAPGASTQPLNWITDNVTTMSQMFVNASVFNQPIDTSGNYWNTGSVTSMFQMFAGGLVTLLFNQPIGNWDTRNVTIMGQMFYGASAFNQNISLWKTGSVTTMFQMFRHATVFNQTINTDASGSWDVSKVTDMSSMFSIASAFNNGALALNWYAPNCTTFVTMFQAATSFNQNVNNLVNTANVIDCNLNSMFQAATIFNNGQLESMDISGNAPFTYTDGTRILTSTGSKFLTQLSPSSDVLIITAGTTTIYTSQIQSIVSDVSLVLLTAYGGALTPTSIKKQVAGSADLSWNTINVKNMSSLFSFAYYFNQKLPWNVSNVTNMSSMFAAGTTALRDLFNNGQLAGSSSQPLNWTATKCTNFTSMFAYTSGFNQPITTLVDTSGVTGCNLTSMFQNTTVFNQNVGAWNVSRVTAMNLMFANTSVFNNGRPLGASDASLNWYVPLCTTFASMFINAGAFNQPISTLVDTSGVAGCSLANMFQNSSTTVATTFNQNLSSWNVSRVTAMNLMFARTGAALPFNNGSLINDASNTFTWYAPNCTTFASMFINTTAFNQPISTLVDTSGVAGCSLTSMFQNAGRFNQNLNSWNVSRVTAMNSMFLRTGTTLPFNNGSLINDASNTLTWYAPNCTTFASMFVLSTAFNQPIPFLVDTSGVAGCSLSNMFQNAGRFNQNLNSWNVSRVTAMNLMFSGASIFNNGQTGTQDISGNLNTSFAFYTNATNLLTCISGNFLTLTSANVLIITTPTLVYSSRIQTNPISDVSLVLLTAYGADIPSGITSINKQIAGTADLSWNTQLVTTTANMFQNATYFNQRLPWNMRVNRIVTSMFAGTATTFINLFNNGQILTGTTPTQPLYPGGGANIWDFSGGTITGGTTNAWRINSRLTSANGVTINPVLVYT